MWSCLPSACFTNGLFHLTNRLGHSDERARHIVKSFYESDSKLLVEQHEIHESEEKLIQSARDTASELESLLQEDTPS